MCLEKSKVFKMCLEKSIGQGVKNVFRKIYRCSKCA